MKRVIRTDSSALLFHGQSDAGNTSPQHVSQAGVSIVREGVELNVAETLHQEVLLLCIKRRPVESAGREPHGQGRFEKIAASSFRNFLQPQRGIGHTKQNPANAKPQVRVDFP